LFRGGSGPDRAIQTLTNAPVNHVGMTVAIDDLPPLIWHAELGHKLLDLWTGTNHRGVQLNDAREAIEQWLHHYGQRCWLRQLTPDVSREHEDQLLKVIARMDGTPFPSTARLTGRWLRGRLPTVSDWTRGIPVVHKKVRQSAERRGRGECLQNVLQLGVACPYLSLMHALNARQQRFKRLHAEVHAARAPAKGRNDEFAVLRIQHYDRLNGGMERVKLAQGTEPAECAVLKITADQRHAGTRSGPVQYLLDADPPSDNPDATAGPLQSRGE
jgi:hypothetical protein